MDYKEIATGFINATRSWVGVSSKEVEDKAEARYKICLKCDTISENKTMCSRDKGGCGCLLYLKTRSNSECPKKYW